MVVIDAPDRVGSPVVRGDPLEDRFRLDTVPAGVWVTVLISTPAFPYIVLWGNPEQTAAMLAVVAAMLLASLALLVLPWRAIIRSRWREAVFAAWSLADYAVIATLAALDGGAQSPFALALFVPIVFASLTYPLPSVLGLGIVAPTVYGALAIVDRDDHTGYAAIMITCLLATVLMAAWQARNHDRWREALELSSRTDFLTGALNRRGFDAAASAMLAAVDRTGRPACMVLLDLDCFKAYNDTHGHLAGDALLRGVVTTIRPTLRPTDALARIGGDEFAILLPDSGPGAAAAVVARLQTGLGALAAHSIGLACAPRDGREIDALYRAADRALYEAKRRDGVRDERRLRPA